MERIAPLLASLCAASALVAACGPELEQEPTEEGAQVVGLTECPHTWQWDSIQAERQRQEHALVPQTLGPELTVPGVHQNVPEYHDCQRFIVPDARGEGLQYDSIFAIFAAFGLDSLGQGAQEGTGPPIFAAAQIWSENTYAPLGIDSAGFSCLYLYRGDGASWNARMVSYGATEVDCTRVRNASGLPPGTELEVRPYTMTGGSGPHYPNVARWDWDEEHRQHYIGIKCGMAQWCEVGEMGNLSVSSPRTDHSNPAWSPNRRRVFEVKGWYDEQYLAEPSTASPTGVRPSAIRGTIFPDTLLGTWDDVSDFASRWVPVAKIALAVPDALTVNPYASKLNLGATRPGGPLNELSLCHGTKSQCSGVPASAPTCGDGLWWTRIVNAETGQAKHRCVIRRALPGVEVVATTRWRWLPDDEGVWERCVEGCCESQTGVF